MKHASDLLMPFRKTRDRAVDAGHGAFIVVQAHRDTTGGRSVLLP